MSSADENGPQSRFDVRFDSAGLAISWADAPWFWSRVELEFSDR
jgi:hypothetical protein